MSPSSSIHSPSDIVAPPSSHLERRLEQVLILAQVARPLGRLHLQGSHVPHVRTTALGRGKYPRHIFSCSLLYVCGYDKMISDG